MTLRFDYIARWSLCVFLGLVAGIVAVRGDMTATVITVALAMLAAVSAWQQIPEQAHR